MRLSILFLLLILNINTFAQTLTNVQSSGKNANIYALVEHMPAPPYDMNEYLSNNLQYPEGARKNKISGKVAVKFVVDEKGNITDCVVIRSVSKELDNEALRVVKMMPKWKPGIKDGKPVKVYFTLPINFKLAD